MAIAEHEVSLVVVMSYTDSSGNTSTKSISIPDPIFDGQYENPSTTITSAQIDALINSYATMYGATAVGKAAYIRVVNNSQFYPEI